MKLTALTSNLPTRRPRLQSALQMSGLTFGIFAAIFLAAAASAWIQVNAAKQAAAERATSVARDIAAQIQNGTIALRQREVEELSRAFRREIAVTDERGTVLIGSQSGTKGGRLVEPQVEQALRERRPVAASWSSQEGEGESQKIVIPFEPRARLVHEGNHAAALIYDYTDLHEIVVGQAIKAATLASCVALLLTLLGWRPISRFSRKLLGALRSVKDELAQSRVQLENRNAELADANRRLERGLQIQQRASRHIQYLAFHDNLTGLANRAGFGVTLSQALERARADGKQLFLFFVDLDRFKQINDTLGHEVGDMLLQETARRLREVPESVSAIARLGGDEFVVLLENASDDAQAESLAKAMLQTIARPIESLGQELRVTASIGISRYPRDGSDEHTLMKNADIALYQAKEGGRDHYALFSSERNRNSLERLALESNLRLAVDRHELLIHYQPKLNFKTGETSGMEALVRWQHPELGMVSPAQFIPIAEETGLIVPIGMWVLRTACRQTKLWQDQGLKNLVVAVNLSPRQLSDSRLLQSVTEILVETGLDAQYLELEITESAIMQDVTLGRQILESLKALGVRIAMDDFGTGYSSLATLQQFPIDTLKIDRSFIKDLPEESAANLTEAIIAMGKAMKLHLVAEGVETIEQKAFLAERGCDELQGYHFSKPLPSDQFAKFFSARERSEATPVVLELNAGERATGCQVANRSLTTTESDVTC